MSTLDPSLEPAIKSAAADLSCQSRFHSPCRDRSHDPEQGDVEKSSDGNTNNSNDEEGEREATSSQDFFEPSRWWFASTASPLLAATFGPVANGFSVCALSSPWRMFLPKGGPEALGKPIADPKWETAINAVSLVCALVGNASLLLNMTHRLPFTVAQPLSITGFLLAGVLLIADMAALTSQQNYDIHQPTSAQPHSHHALGIAFYYAVFAAAIYILIAALLCMTVWGALKGYYARELRLTQPQRTLMLQTMAFVAYLLLGALVYSHLEGWPFLDAVYWADVSLLTVGLGDYAPTGAVARGLFFPFELGGVLMLGLVVGSIRTLVLERGDEKLSARMVEKKRSSALKDVDERRQTVKISVFARADFSTDPTLSNAQRREEEFNVMRKVQDTADRERRWFGLATSSAFALMLWFVGAAVFMQCEYLQGWTYFQSLYFSYVVLLTIGYGDFVPKSNSGKAFFVFWSLLAVPSLTILISNMGDTVVQWFKDLTAWFGSITLLPDEKGFRGSMQQPSAMARVWWQRFRDRCRRSTFLGLRAITHEKRTSPIEYEARMREVVAERLAKHLTQAEMHSDLSKSPDGDRLRRDNLFYAYVLACECRGLRRDIVASPPKKYDWTEWEYYLRLMGDGDEMVDPCTNAEQPPREMHTQNQDGSKFPARGLSARDTVLTILEEQEEKEASPSNDNNHDANNSTASDDGVSPLDGNVDRRTSVVQQLAAQRRRRRARRIHPELEPEPDYLASWSWLSNESPLMSQKSESEWILDRLSAALERALDRQRKGVVARPPVGVADAVKVGGREIEKETQGDTYAL